MNASTSLNPPAIGTRMDGGFFVGAILTPGGPLGLIKLPRAALELDLVEWGPADIDVAGAHSPIEGPANTLAMANAGSALARRIFEFRFEGKQDYYLPAQDELEVIYRACKPTADQNSAWSRSGINLHAYQRPTPPYAIDPDAPAQTVVEIFRAGGAEAFETNEPYWTSTQRAGDSSYAWGQWFGNGYQLIWGKDDKCRACLVRRFPI